MTFNIVSKRYQGTVILKSDCKQPLRIGIIRALNECTGRLFRATTRHNHKSSETWHTDECHANVNADVNGIHTKIYLFLLPRGKETKSTYQHTTHSAEDILRHEESYICRSVQIAEFQQKVNRSRSPHLDQSGRHVTVYVMVNLKPCSYELVYV